MNPRSGIGKLSAPQLKSIATAMKELPITQEESKKAWFIFIPKIFAEKNLKIFYLPFPSLEKLLAAKSFAKIPDPVDYFAGISFLKQRTDSNNFHQTTTKTQRRLANQLV